MRREELHERGRVFGCARSVFNAEQYSEGTDTQDATSEWRMRILLYSLEAYLAMDDKVHGKSVDR